MRDLGSSGCLQRPCRAGIGAALDSKGEAGDMTRPSAAGDLLAVGVGAFSAFYASAQTSYFPKASGVSPIVVQAGGAVVMVCCTMLTVAATQAFGVLSHPSRSGGGGFGSGVIPWSTEDAQAGASYTGPLSRST
jgi:hypothetical protein